MDVNLLKQKLNSERTEERLSGLREAIAESEALAVYVIKDYIKNEKSDTILSAMLIACAKIGGESEVDFIGSFLEHENFRIQKYAFQSLLLINSHTARPYILKAMTGGEPRLKQMAVKVIRELGKKKCLETIEAMLISEVEWQRVSALEALEMLNNVLYENELIDILVRAIGSAKKDYCAESVEKLKKIYETGSEYAVESVKKLLRSDCGEELKKIISKAIPQAVEPPAGAAPETAPRPEVKPARQITAAPQAQPGPVEKDEELITDFSNYIDKVSRTRPRKKVVISTARETRPFYVLWFLNILLCFKWLAILPFRLVYAHKLKFSAMSVAALLLYFYVCPEAILGKGSFDELKTVSQQSLSDYLARKGYIINRDSAGNILAFSHDYWINSLEAAEKYFGKAIIFSAYEINLKNSEIFEGTAFFDGYGAVSAVTGIKNLTETAMADEEELVALRGSFAYLSSARDGVKILTIQDGDYSNKRQFLFKQNLVINNITNSSLAANLIKVETRKGENLRNVSLNVDSGNIDPPDFPVEYIPGVEADEPFIPKLVEKVRNLGFVGPEKIARLEDFYYNTADYLKRKFYSGYEEEEDAARVLKGREDEGEEVENAKAHLTADRKRENTAANHGPAAENTVGGEVKTPTGPEIFSIITLRFDSVLITAAKHLICFDLMASIAETIRGPLAGVLESAKTYATGASLTARIPPAISNAAGSTAETGFGGCRPPDIEPLLKKTPLKDEGVWVSAEVALADGTPIAFQTKLRVDAKRPFAIMHLFCVEIARINLHLVAGTNEPVSSIGLKGKGVIPNDEATYQNLICAFNGGFRTKHGRWGFIADGVSYLPPVKGIATVTVDSFGAIKMGTWGAPGFDTTENIIHLRQNLPPILENNIVNMKHDYWGASIDNKTRVWRSALGISRDGKWLIYGAGNSLGHDTLAAGMSLAGCDYAMQLDINDYHTYLYAYKRNASDKKGNQKLKAVRLSDEMSGETKRCLEPYTRDFFYVTLKRNEVKTASSR